MFGDGSVWAVSLPGHTVGHMGLLVRGSTSASQYCLLVGDAAWSSAAYRNLAPPSKITSHVHKYVAIVSSNVASYFIAHFFYTSFGSVVDGAPTSTPCLYCTTFITLVQVASLSLSLSLTHTHSLLLSTHSYCLS